MTRAYVCMKISDYPHTSWGAMHPTNLYKLIQIGVFYLVIENSSDFLYGQQSPRLDLPSLIWVFAGHCRRQEALKQVLICRLSLGAHWDWTAIFIKNILCYHCLRDSGLYIQKIMTKREMVNCQKFDFFLFLTINSVTTAGAWRFERD